MEISNLATDEAVLAAIGQRLANRRLELGMTQADLAKEAGVAKRTLERIEAGASAQLSSLVRVLRALEMLPLLDHALPDASPTPMERLEQLGKRRQRASKKRKTRPASGKHWQWRE